MTNFYAHSANDGGEWHGLADHLAAVAETAGRFCEPFASHDPAYYSGLWHDVGKFDPEFQSYLAGKRKQGPDHKGAGAQLALQHCGPLAMLVQGHHGGLRAFKELQGWTNEKGNASAATAAIAAARHNIPDLVPIANLRPPAWVNKSKTTAEMWLRMVFSALVDADFLDTERHFQAGKSAQRASTFSMSELWNRFQERHQARMRANEPISNVDQIRTEVYEACKSAAGQPSGIFRLAVPTGGGKTLSAMGFALRHAVEHEMERVIVAVPFVSITQQTTAEYRRFLEDPADEEMVVLEHHSSVETNDADEFDPSAAWARLASENWDCPIVVTTTVQLFNSLFSNRTSSTRKLHNLARSVIILDEAQALPPKLLEPILDGLRELSENYGATVVLSTATQPAFRVVEPFANVHAADIVPSPERHFQALRRVRYEWSTDPAQTWDDIAEIMRTTPQALAIVNTKKDALASLDALNDEQALHLSTLLCGRHRRDVIEEIKRRLREGEECRVVSTQVVEAGVDLDFPLVLRAIGPLDSIIQAAGRCNRNGQLDEGRVVVFDTNEASAPPFGSYRTATGITKAMLNSGPMDPDNPQVVEGYFRQLYEGVDTDAEQVQTCRSDWDYPEVAKRFRMIDDDTVTIVVTTYGTDNEQRMVQEAVTNLRNGTPDARRLIRTVQPWTASMYHNQATGKERDGLLWKIMPGLFEWVGEYHPITGLGGATVAEPDRFIV